MMTRTILLADNDTHFLTTQKELLEKEGYRIVCATDPVGARRILEQGGLDLAILDMRLVDDNDTKDISGVLLAKEAARSVPKIILTAFPTWKAVRDALGPDLDGLSPAVDFLSKAEGPHSFLRAIELTLMRPELRSNILDTFQVSSLMALVPRITDIGPEESSRRFQKSFADTAKQLTQYREQENKRASEYHWGGLLTAACGTLLVGGSVILIWLGYMAPVSLPIIVGAIVQAASLLFFVREDAAYKRVSSYFAQLYELNKLGNLLAICDSLTSQADREEYKRRIIDKVIESWFSSISKT